MMGAKGMEVMRGVSKLVVISCGIQQPRDGDKYGIDSIRTRVVKSNCEWVG